MSLFVAHGSPADDDVLFVEATSVGLDFVHVNGMTGEFFFPEMVGPGGGFVDFDGDGDLDLYLVQGGEHSSDGNLSGGVSDRLLRNDSTTATDGSRALKFTDVTDAAGIRASGYGMGLATGDYNNDGWTDLYVTNLESNQLFRNDGDGTFTDVTDEARVAVPRWSTSASWLDYDRDGWLDLYVTNYVKFDAASHPKCYSQSSARDYCGPKAFDPDGDVLFRNLGSGAFEEVTARVFGSPRPGAGLGVVASDLNGDGWVDIYVANDGMANQLWIHQTNGVFRDEALLAGVALNWMGQAEASMGVDAGDFDGDGDDDLFMTHLEEETNTLYVNDGTGLFEDGSLAFGLGAPSLALTGFGSAWFDIDNDGWLDLLVVNGAVRIVEELARRGDPYPLHQTNQLFRNDGGSRFVDVTASGGPAFGRSEVSRGAAFGDVDNDGDTDVLVINNNGPARLLVNHADRANHWIGLRLVGASAKRDMLGARVEVATGDGRRLWRRVRADGSYGSAHDPRVLVGLGDADMVASVRVVWPDGSTEEWAGISIDRYTVLGEGTGRTLN